MSVVTVVPDLVSEAARQLRTIGSSLTAAHAAAAAPTTEIVAAAQDEVSGAIASVFSSTAKNFYSLSTQAEAFHAAFTRALAAAGNTYASAESDNAAALLARTLASSAAATDETVLEEVVVEIEAEIEEVVEEIEAFAVPIVGSAELFGFFLELILNEFGKLL